ncbi:MAG TPA: glycosyltransferase family 39 protein [Anaerolineales bacterium]|nr:glycosyltransferase family 39 protein [Anaerolineales bacterium]
MKIARNWKAILFSDLGVLIWLAIGLLVLHTLTNNQYGFHRDELNFLDDGRHLAWGYVDCPPLAPVIARLSLVLFGKSLVGLRFFPALAQSLVLILTGLMVRELGGKRWAQITASIASATAPVALSEGSLFMYLSFDMLWWVLTAYFTIRLLHNEDARWWLGIGVALGLGMLTKFTIAYLAAGIVAGVLFTPVRRYLKSPWLWAGAGLALLFFLPNLIWMAQHNYITLEKLIFVHNRDVQAGYTRSFLPDQLYVSTNIAALFLWLGGLRYFWLDTEGRRFRLIGWMFAVPFAFFLIMQGRGYYTAPLYPMLIAGGTYAAEKRRLSMTGAARTRLDTLLYTSLTVSGLVAWAFSAPIAPLNSTWWKLIDQVSPQVFREEIGWPELVQQIAGIRDTLPAKDRSQLGILANNYGEAGAINLYGPAYNLPIAISGIDSYWLWGYGDPPPQTLIVVGFKSSTANSWFQSCTRVGTVTNPYGIKNEETSNHNEILLCRKLLYQWPAFWKKFHWFG